MWTVIVTLPEKTAALNGLTDEELAALARENAEQAFPELVVRFTPMIRRQAAMLHCPSDETEDWTQEGVMGLLMAVRSYEPGASSFRTYASVCVRNRLISLIKKKNAARVIPSSEMVSMDDEQGIGSDVPSGQGDPVAVLLQKEDDSRFQRLLKSSLSDVEYRALTLYVEAYSYREISKKLGIGVKAVDNALQRVRQKLKQAVF